jgi:predicted transcriptional regulator
MANPVTSLKIPAELKERVAAVIEGTDQSAHAFMVEAIERQTSLAEKRRQFLAEADAAEGAMLATGKGYDGNEVHSYMRARAQGKKAKRPRAKAWRS